ncbi:putative purine permease [Arachis hypogaea]|nr:putative purine permease [Arachis hypogaea]
MKSTLKKKTKTTKSTLEKKNKQNHQNWATRKDKKNCMQQIKNLPETRVSTSSLLLSFQLGFNLVLSVIMGKQKITFWNLTTVILITLSYILLALNSNRERPNSLAPLAKLVMEVTVTALVTVGMVFLDGFWYLKKEAKLVFDKGERIYWVLIGEITGSFCC